MASPIVSVTGVNFNSGRSVRIQRECLPIVRAYSVTVSQYRRIRRVAMQQRKYFGAMSRYFFGFSES